jgi:diguanylate cyclase (GGDEF)-like protein/PAS domain S-box-containing protein
MENKFPPWDRRALLLANLAIVAVFVVQYLLLQALDLPPGRAPPLFPPAGVAFALWVVAGWRVLPGTLLGAMLLHLRVFWLPDVPFNNALLAWTAATLGPTVQAGLGAYVFRRTIDPALASVRDVGRFLLLAPLMCVVSATFALGFFYALGRVSRIELDWLNWWAGDTLGILLAAPLCWIATAQPRPLWRGRARLVALPLLLAGAAVGATYRHATHWENEQHLGAFRVKAQQATDMIQAAFGEHARFSEIVARALADRSDMLPGARFQRIANAYAEGHPELQRLFWMVRVRDSERPGFESWARANVDPAFRITEIDAAGTLRPAGRRAQHFVILYAAPPLSLGLGLDYLGEPARAGALLRAMRSGRATATPPLRLVLLRTGIVLVRTIGTVPGEPYAAIALSFDANRVVRRALGQAGLPDVEFEFVDITEAGHAMLAGGQLFDTPRRGEVRLGVHFGERRYRLAFAPYPLYLSQAYGWASWTVMTTGMLLTALLGALMLLTTGERARIESVVANRTARLQAILDHAADPIVTVDAQGTVVSANPATEHLFGQSAARLARWPLADVASLGEPDPRQALERLAGAPPEQRELQGKNARGEAFPLEISVAPLRLEDEQLYVCILRDLTEQRRSQESIYRLAHYDALTGLVNRHALGGRLEEHLALARRSRGAVAVIFIDLDRFKLINDTYGHEAGDQLLVAASRRMAELLRRDIDTLARLGGDEFVIVLGGPLTPETVTTVAVRLVHSLAQPYELAGATVYSGSSVGVALFPDDGADASTLMRNADTAMYAAKRAGRGNFQFFSEAMNATTHEHLRLESRMRAALAEGRLELHLQPQIALATGRVVGAEMLLRWNDSELGQVEPTRAIAVAEESGLILALGDWVLGRAMALLAEWNRAGIELRLAVNLSARQFASSSLLARLDLLLAENLIDPACLELEITETAAMRDPENTRRLLDQLHQRGLKLAIDDFGTGYSSLAYLKLFPIDLIKIDCAFVKDIESDPNDAAIVAATIGLAHTLGLGVLAEGVETQGQWDFLHDRRSDEAQGFLFAPAMPPAEFLAFLKERAQPVPGPSVL